VVSVEYSSNYACRPDVFTGQYSSNCCTDDYRFDASKVQPIHTALLSTWPNLIAGEHVDAFWQHEWTKHGTCAESVPAFDGELNYFNQSVTLNRQINLIGCKSKD
jgi:ribonuclease T2